MPSQRRSPHQVLEAVLGLLVRLAEVKDVAVWVASAHPVFRGVAQRRDLPALGALEEAEHLLTKAATSQLAAKVSVLVPVCPRDGWAEVCQQEVSGPARRTWNHHL